MSGNGPQTIGANVQKGCSKYIPAFKCIMLCIHQYSVHILYKHGPDLYIADWLSKNNHVEKKDQVTTGMNINIHAISAAVSISI